MNSNWTLIDFSNSEKSKLEKQSHMVTSVVSKAFSIWVSETVAQELTAAWYSDAYNAVLMILHWSCAQIYSPGLCIILRWSRAQQIQQRLRWNSHDHMNITGSCTGLKVLQTPMGGNEPVFYTAHTTLHTLKVTTETTSLTWPGLHFILY